jgi:site-specific recombinase XerD
MTTPPAADLARVTALLDLLTADRQAVGAIWRTLGCSRVELQRTLAAHYEALVRSGLRLHTATVSQASARSLFIEIDSRRYSHISRDAVVEAAAAPLAPLAPRPQVADVVRDPLALAVAAWLDSKHGRSGSARTRDSYAAALADFRAALGRAQLDLLADSAAVALVAQAWAQMSARGRTVKPATVAQRLAIISSFYAFALRRRLLPLTENPIELVERPKVESYAEAQALDTTTVRKALAALKVAATGDGLAGDLAARDLALLRVALTTGRRVAELARLRWRDLAIEAGRVTITVQRAKGGKVMRDTLATDVGSDLLRWLHRHHRAELGELAPDAAIWPVLKGGGVAGRGRIGAALTAQGIAEVVARRLGSHPHALRHSFAQAMERDGATVSTIQARLGHSNLATTGRYLTQLGKAENAHADALARLFDAEVAHDEIRDR